MKTSLKVVSIVSMLALGLAALAGCAQMQAQLTPGTDQKLIPATILPRYTVWFDDNFLLKVDRYPVAKGQPKRGIVRLILDDTLAHKHITCMSRVKFTNTDLPTPDNNEVELGTGSFSSSCLLRLLLVDSDDHKPHNFSIGLIYQDPGDAPPYIALCISIDGVSGELIACFQSANKF